MTVSGQNALPPTVTILGHEGAAAFLKGEKSLENPYSVRDPAHVSWAAGFSTMRRRVIADNAENSNED